MSVGDEFVPPDGWYISRFGDLRVGQECAEYADMDVVFARTDRPAIRPPDQLVIARRMPVMVEIDADVLERLLADSDRLTVHEIPIKTTMAERNDVRRLIHEANQ